mmetsp:Transcript_34719/g.87285  ORF Transcript_34719/g.87285 Transcript_34719/m.87285 type:complete len:203 (-) Transcript_34719:2562-3170(-)
MSHALCPSRLVRTAKLNLVAPLWHALTSALLIGPLLIEPRNRAHDTWSVKNTAHTPPRPPRPPPRPSRVRVISRPRQRIARLRDSLSRELRSNVRLLFSLESPAEGTRRSAHCLALQRDPPSRTCPRSPSWGVSHRSGRLHHLSDPLRPLTARQCCSDRHTAIDRTLHRGRILLPTDPLFHTVRLQMTEPQNDPLLLDQLPQ